MNTKTIMTFNALIYGIVGLAFTFAPDNILSYINLSENKMLVLFVQITGALYFAFGTLNWISRKGLIGGIYNRPIAIANFAHSIIAGLAILKQIIANPDLPYAVWAGGIIYTLSALLFGIILTSHPINKKAS